MRSRKLKAEENVTSNSPRSKARCFLNQCFKLQLTPSKVKVVWQFTLFKGEICKDDKKEKRHVHKLMLISYLEKYKLL